LSPLPNEANCTDGHDNDCNGFIDQADLNCPKNSLNFSGILNYSNGQPVKNSLIKITVINSTLGFVRYVTNLTNSSGYFFVRMDSIPENMVNVDFNISFYVMGEVEAVYDCWYNHTSITKRCCKMPLTGPCT